MASTYSDRIKIEKIATGEKSGEWGTITNNNFDRIDIAVNGIVSIAMTSAEQSSGAAKSIALGTSTVDEAGRHQFIEFTAGSPTPTGTLYAQLQLNTAEKVCFIRNSTAQTLIVFQGTYSASNDLEIAAGKDAVVKFDGGGSGAVVELALKDPEFSTVKATTFTGNLTGNLTGDVTGDVTGNADTATALATARTIGGVSFDGTANINLPGVNTAGNQDTTGNAATATTATTATTGTNVTVTSNSSTNETVYLTFVDGTSGSQGIEVDSGLTYNPSTNILGNTAVKRVSPTTTSENNGGYHLLFSDEYNTTGLIYADFSLSVNPSTNILSAGGFSTTGSVSGGTVSGSSSQTINNYVAQFTNTVSSTASSSKLMKLRFSDATIIDGADFIEFHDGGGAIGSVSSTSSSGGVNYNTSSDARLKRNVEDAPSQWHTIRNMDVREYEWISSGQSEIGFIAQELNAVAPQCVTEGGESPTQDPWSVDYGRITPFLVKALQEAMDRIEELEDRLDQVS